jgi:hypothetical protein
MLVMKQGDITYQNVEFCLRVHDIITNVEVYGTLLHVP